MRLLDLELQAEREKLGRLLDTPADELEVLDTIGVAGMRQLRGTVEAHIFDRGAKRFAGLARSSRLLPGKVSGLIAQRALGPRLAAQVTGLLEPELAVNLSRHVSTPFQADLCQFLDPRRAGPVLRAMPLPVVVETSRELVAREEYITMARFVDDLRDEQIQAVAAILDADALLWIGFYTESGQRLSHLMAMLDDAAVLGTMRVAAANDWWPQSLSIMARADEATATRMTHLLAWADAQLGLSLLESVAAQDLWEPLGEVLARSDDSDLRRIEAQLSDLAPDAIKRLKTVTGAPRSA